MLRMLLTTTALVAVTGTSFAASHLSSDAPAATEMPMTGAAMEAFDGDFMLHPAENTLYSDEVAGMTVYTTNARDESIGEVEELLLSRDGSIQAAIVGIGGFLEIGEKDVAVSWDSLQFHAMDDNQDGAVDERFFVLAGTSREALEAAPAFDYDYRDQVEMAAVRDEMARETPDMPREAPDGVAVVDTPMMGTDRDAMTTVGFNEVRAEDLIGQRVYGHNDQDIGEIGDLILTADGTVDAVIIDFGGFLGMGEKEVAVGFESVDMRRDENDMIFVYTDLSEDELKAAPAYDAATYQDRRDEYRTISGPASRS